ncbi:MAG: aldose 1-epimerase family protein [Lachnospiraceae bacterium]|jgi:galactose mutarotase-like enzyme
MIFTIQDAKASASIDSLGAQLISYQDAEGQEYIWQRDPKYWANCSPILFPAVGRVRNGKTLIDGTWYEMPLHGFVKVTEFETVSQTPTQVTLSMSDSEATRKIYPFAFCLEVSYSLTDGVLTMECKVKNTDSRELPFFIGTHPGFVCPLKDGETFEDYVLEFEKKETCGYRAFDGATSQFDMTGYKPFPGDGIQIPLTYDLLMNDAIWFDEPVSRAVSVKNPATGKGISVAYPDYDTVAFWTAAELQAPYICVEPWNGSAACSDEDDEFIHKNHLQTLQPGEDKSYRLIIHSL